MSDDVQITVRVNNQTQAGFRDINGQLRTLDGRFAGSSRQASILSRAYADVRASLLSLAPAAVPVAASLAPIAVQAGAAGVALGAFGAAVIPQISNLADAAKAQDKYTQAVTQYGAQSKQATQAQQQAAQTLAGMPQATQRAAAAYSNLRGQFKSFSDSTAKFTMAPVEHSFAVLGALIPKLTPMVADTSTQLNRLVTIAGGAVNTSGFDALSKKVADFANSSLKSATDAAVHLIRTLSEGNAHGPIASFMEYARAQGPAVKELITNLAKAVSNLLEGAAQAGPGMLTLVNAFAKLVAAVPPSLIGTLMSVYTAFKLIKLAGAGVGAIAGGYARLAARVAELRAASVAAGGGIRGLQTALGGLSTGGKAAVALGVVGALVTVMHELSTNKGAVAVDQLSSSLNTLASTGKVTGSLKTNFTDMAESIAMVSKSASDNKVTQLVSDFGTFVGISTGPGISTARKNVDAWDKSMANLVKGGHSKEAAAQYNILKKAWVAGGGDLKRLNKFTDDYKSALADQKFEAKMTADSMGLFGDQAQKVSTKLDEQKASADGLRESIQALNDANRQGLGGMIGFEQAIDDAAEAAKKNAGALSMSHGVLNLNSQKARDAASALQDLADKTDSAAASARESGSSWATVNGVYSRGRTALIKNAEAMGLTKEQAAQLANQILKIPDKTSTIKMNKEDAQAGLEAFNAAVKKTPGSKSVTLKTLSKGAESILEAFGFKVKRLPNGKVTVTTQAGGALSTIANVSGAISRLDGKTATTYVVTNYTQQRNKGYSGNSATGGHAAGGLVRGYAGGGGVQAFPDGGYIQGPGNGTSDSILAFMGSGAVAAVSNTEYVMKAAAVRKYGVKMMDALNDGRLPVAHLAKGGLSQAAKDARSGLSSQFGISSFGRTAGYSRTPFEKSLGAPADVSSLVSSLNDAASKIRAAFSGKTESNLLKHLHSVGKSLIGYEKQLNKVTASLSSAKDKLSSLKDAASQLSSSVKSNLVGSANITKAASSADGGTVTLASVKSGLVASRDKVTAFASALKRLKAKGFSKSIIQQVAEAGIDGGGLETAGALLEASASEVASINQMQGQIASAAGAAGKTTADSVYAKAIKDQTAVVNKLTKQQDKLEKSMASLAKSMEKLIKQALKGKAAGGIVGAAASGGLRGGLTWVGEHEPELLDLPVGSRVWSGPDSRRKAAEAPWASMLTTSRRTPAAHAPAAAGHSSGGGQPLVIQLKLGTREFGEVWVDVGRSEVRARGGIEATLKPPRGR